MSDNPKVTALKEKYKAELADKPEAGVTPLTDFEKACLYQGLDPKTEVSESAKTTVKEDKRDGSKVTQEQETTGIKDTEKKTASFEPTKAKGQVK